MPAPIDHSRVREMCDRYQAGESTYAVGRSMGVTRDTVRKWLVRKGIKRRSPPMARKVYRLDGDAFRVIQTEEQAYWLGFLGADGNVFGNRISLGLAIQDCEHVERFRSFLQTDAPIAVDDVAARLQIYSQGLAAQLLEHGIGPRKSFTLEPPSIRRDLRRHWIRGLCDGDGSIGVRRRGSRGYAVHVWRVISTHAVSRWITVQFDEALGLGRDRKIGRAGDDDRIGVLAYCGRLQVAAICRWLYADCTVALTRKHLTALQIASTPQHDLRYKSSSPTGRFQ